MKTILIPTILEEDTVNAVRTALEKHKTQTCIVVLLLVKEAPDTFDSSAAVRNLSFTYSATQEHILDNCRRLFSSYNNAALKIHHQFGISKPLLRNIMQYYKADFAILTPSVKNSRNKAVCNLVRLLLKSKYTLLHLNSVEIQSLSSALYIEHKTAFMDVQQLQQLLSNKFNIRIVSRTKIGNELALQDANPLIAETILNKQIDLLVETRCIETKNTKRNALLDSKTFGVPVLSIYEEDLIN